LTVEADDAALVGVDGTTGSRRQPKFFDNYYRQEYRRVLGLAYVLTGNVSVAEDTAQDAFTAAYRQWAAIGGYDSPAAWVRRVTCNRAASGHRRNRPPAWAPDHGGPLRRVLRRVAAPPPRTPRPRDAPDDHPAGGLHDLVRRDVASLVCRTESTGAGPAAARSTSARPANMSGPAALS